MLLRRNMPVIATPPAEARVRADWRGRIEAIHSNGWATIRWDLDTPSPVRNQEVLMETLQVVNGVARFRVPGAA